ncbi:MULTISPECIES: hypothetical protein [Haloarcula]|uniref:Uncharacterized protein n=3 Tax=Haloarcula marismortui TaxID=2238 RepID=A0A4P8K1S6_HALMA|nr:MULTISPECIES: hypothetical protein [Haloarcula]EMA13155.1 hypothetical protein C436_12098 [Haloarcula sinaiiensis ATCC 33800]EMA21950.1 hypothetical protein C435_04968 [Haloarcula californiae ATCC 33799]NHN65006.1 hypothetical protein [Haloarcula sp. JP-Z28]NHX38881.1 hypothetical protein [Haloarcula sp. R1-2]QCP93047.1 hypothetical protein E6P14_20075 [Haloarcula marismortui ATCC 43049]
MTIQRMLFREPDGRQKGLLFSLFSFICILGWVYFGIVLDGPHNMLFLGIAFAFSGFAEFLPPNRRRSAGVLRMLGLGTLVVFVILLISVPESIWG